MRSVLVVDDDDTFRSVIARELSARGYSVTAAACAEEAATRLRELKPKVLLTDLRMGTEDGIDLIHQARRFSEHTRSILMSAFATARDYQAAVEAGALTVLCKPFDFEELTRAIDHALECENGFRGNLHGVGLVDLVQMFHLTRRNIRLTIEDASGSGSIEFQNGEIIDARWQETVGNDALIPLLSSSSGTIGTAPAKGAARTVFGAFDRILLDALRQADEKKRPSTSDSLSGEWSLDVPAASTPTSSDARTPQESSVTAENVPQDIGTLKPSLSRFREHVERVAAEFPDSSWQIEVVNKSSSSTAATYASLARAVDAEAANIEVLGVHDHAIRC